MPRDLKRIDTNKLVIDDAISGGKITLYYRQPTAEEYIAYSTTIVRREDGKVKFDELARIDFALSILTGAADGCLTLDDKPVSTQPGTEHYNADWKEMLRDTAADWLQILAGVAFDGSSKERSGEVPFPRS